MTYTDMGLLPAARPGCFAAGGVWSGDDLQLHAAFRLGGEIAVTLPPVTPRRPAPRAWRRLVARLRWRS